MTPYFKANASQAIKIMRSNEHLPMDLLVEVTYGQQECKRECQNAYKMLEHNEGQKNMFEEITHLLH